MKEKKKFETILVEKYVADSNHTKRCFQQTFYNRTDAEEYIRENLQWLMSNSCDGRNNGYFIVTNVPMFTNHID